jgi:hypothetical protein
MVDIEYVLSTTAIPYSRVGDVITCADISGCIALANAIFLRTADVQPLNNQGYALGTGTLLADRGNNLFLKLPSGETVIQYRLFKQITPQQSPPLPSPAGDTPNGTIGYGIVFESFGINAGTAGELYYIDPIRFVRVG